MSGDGEDGGVDGGGGDGRPEPDYEQARDELARVVSALEAGGLGLEDALALWERGEALARTCERHLAGARRRVEDALRSADDVPSSGPATRDPARD